MQTYQKIVTRGSIIGPITPLNELKIYPEPNSGCWLWVGGGNGCGYGLYWCRREKRKRYAHRVVYESHFGPILGGLDLDHICRTPCCVNPAHLEPVSRSSNIMRGHSPSLTARRNAERAKAVTHCPKGHEYTLENTYLQPRSGHSRASSRKCRTCDRIRDAQRRAKRKSMGTRP